VVKKTGADEEKWAAFAAANTASALRLEVRDAIRTGRTEPREGTFGLPNGMTDFSVGLTREQDNLREKAMELAAADMVEERGEEGWRPSPEEVLLRIFEDVLRAHHEEKRKAGGKKKGASRARRRSSPYSIVYVADREKRRSHVLTKDGPVEVPYEHVERIAGEARTHVVRPDEELERGEALIPRKGKGGRKKTEGEVPAALAAKVLALHDHRCAHCGRTLGIHLHHIIFRANGGPHSLANLLPCCRRCHGALHARTLEVFRDAFGQLYWRRKADRIEKLMGEELEELRRIPAVTIIEAARLAALAPRAADASARSAPSPATASPTAPPIAVETRKEAEFIVEAMTRKLRYGRDEARARVAAALASLSGLGRRPTGDEIFRAALGRKEGDGNSSRAEKSGDGDGAPEAKRS